MTVFGDLNGWYEIFVGFNDRRLERFYHGYQRDVGLAHTTAIATPDGACVSPTPNSRYAGKISKWYLEHIARYPGVGFQ